MPRQGFSILDVAIAVAIIAVLSASIFPTVAERARYSRVTDATKVLRELGDAVWAFRADVSSNPGSLRDLTTPITTSGTNSCGAPYSSANVTAWAGPYYKRQEIGTTGLTMSSDNFGRAQTAMVRTPVGVGSPGTLSIVLTSVQLDGATELNALVEGDGNNTTGRVRWTVPADAQGFVTLSYHVAINGC